jgi:hypothetical protein
MDMTSLSLSRCSDAKSEGAPLGGSSSVLVLRASEGYACAMRAAILNVRIDGLPLERFDRIPADRLRAVEPALESNVDLRKAYGVPGRFRDLMVRHGATLGRFVPVGCRFVFRPKGR